MRDLDLIAVPWTEEAVSDRDLLDALSGTLDCMYGPRNERPHGRIGYVLHGFAGCKYVDLSVTPRKARLPARVVLNDPTKPPPLKAISANPDSPRAA